ncbi:MAG TPA: carbohydrate binding domain-containing protein [Sedimentisphaerales bacterium]|nr:carbohydrate binding domain-containing protein [Sedimentisphaerales bacterium]
MCKRLIYLTCFVLVLVAFPLVTHAQVENLALNPSFEEDEVILDDPDWEQWCTWNPDEGAGSSVTVVDTEFIDGTRSLRVDPKGPENWHFIVVYISFPADLNKNYTASFWAKAEEPRPLTVQMKAADNSVDAWGATDFELTTEWAEYHYTSEVLHTDVKLEFLDAGSEVPHWLDFLYIYEGEYVAGIEPGASPKVKATSPNPADGTIHPDTWVNLSWKPGVHAVSHDVYFGDNLNDVNNVAEGTFVGNQNATFVVVGFPGFAFPDGLVPGTTYYWRIDEVNDADPNSPWKGDVWSFSIPPKTAYFPNPADGAESVNPNVELSWTEGFGSKLHTIYFGDNFDDVNNATGGLPQGTLAYTPGPLKLAQTYYWRVDEFDAIDTYKGDVWSFSTQGAVGSLDPSNGAVDVKRTQIITWSPNVYAASHEVYFGTDKDTVKNADTGSPEYKGTRDLGTETYDPGKLELGVTYYWRIDEVNSANPDSPWPGILWSFTTANFLVVDDFEDYDSGDNQIWYTWKDGLGYGTPGTDPYSPGNGTGSAVGDESTASFTEETIVHGGNQSMPFWYDNSILKYSEVDNTLTYPRDWTEDGVTTLTIWFRGDSANAAETLYVALNGSAVVNHDNPDAAQTASWTQWNIDLQAFADQGVNLANVNLITLGLGNRNNPAAGGAGTMYFDDIRLYAP